MLRSSSFEMLAVVHLPYGHEVQNLRNKFENSTEKSLCTERYYQLVATVLQTCSTQRTVMNTLAVRISQV